MKRPCYNWFAMRTLFAVILACMLLAAVPAQARTFGDLRTDAVEAPARAWTALIGWHPLALFSAAARRSSAGWDESFLRLDDLTAIGIGGAVLGVEAVRSTTDRAVAVFAARIMNSGPPPSSAAPASIGAAVAPPPAPAPDPSGARWIDQTEKLFRQKP